MKTPKICMFPSCEGRYADKPNPSQSVLRGLKDAGAEVVLVDYTKDEDTMLGQLFECDGLMLQGGPDADPAYFGEEMHPTASMTCPVREAYEMFAVHQAVKQDIPTFAICRGIQVLNVALGGSLYQDVPSQLGVNHSSSGLGVDFWHEVTIKEGSLVHKIAGKTKLYTNSYHHQAVKLPGEDLVITASCGTVVEAIELPDAKFFLGLQWHPEVTLDKDETSHKFFDAFIAACK